VTTCAVISLGRTSTLARLRSRGACSAAFIAIPTAATAVLLTAGRLCCDPGATRTDEARPG
jgi:hypothetical protein